MPKLSSLAARVGGPGADAWAVHYEALARRAAGHDVIVLSVGQEMNEVTPSPIVDAAVASLRAGRHHYTPTNGEPALRAAIARHHEARTGQHVDPGQVTVFAGAQNALFATALCLLEHGDEVVLCEPYYTTYPATFTTGGARLVSVATPVEDGFQADPERVAAAFSPATRAVVVNSPNNPTGAIYDRARIEAIVAACAARGIWVIADEVYADLLPAGAHASVASAPGADDCAVTVSSVSKSHRMTGWRLGWAIAPPALARTLRDLCLCMSYGLPPFIQDAGVAAFALGDSVSATVRASLDAKRALLADALGEIAPARLVPTAGGMFVLLDVRPLGVSTTGFAQTLLDEHHVAVLPCDGFGAAGAGLLRLSVCESESSLRAGGERIRAHIARLAGQGDRRVDRRVDRGRTIPWVDRGRTVPST